MIWLAIAAFVMWWAVIYLGASNVIRKCCQTELGKEHMEWCPVFGPEMRRLSVIESLRRMRDERISVKSDEGWHEEARWDARTIDAMIQMLETTHQW